MASIIPEARSSAGRPAPGATILLGSYSCPITRLSTKGQLILPKEIRTARAWGPGTEFIVEETQDGILLRPSGRFPATRIEDVAGCLGYKGKAKTLAQMDATIRREVSRRHDRGRY
jgi:AbrB family looped-hinge helix DNA binding protein